MYKKINIRVVGIRLYIFVSEMYIVSLYYFIIIFYFFVIIISSYFVNVVVNSRFVRYF